MATGGTGHGSHSGSSSHTTGTGGRGGIPTATPGQLALEQIAQTSKATANLLTRLLAVARFGPTAGGGGGLPGIGGGTREPAWMTAERARADAFEEQRKREYWRAGSAAFREQQARTNEQASAFSRLGFSGISGGMNRMTGYAEGMRGMGLPGSGLMSRAAPVLGMTITGLNTSASVSRIFQDERATSGQRERALARLLPGGETVQGWYDTFSGRERGIARVEEQHGLAQIGVQRESALQNFGLEYGGLQAGRQARADVMGASSPTLMANIEQRTAAGKRQFEIESRMLPLRQATAKADREAIIATKEREAAQKRLNGLFHNGLMLEGERHRIEKALAGDGNDSGVPRQDLLRQAQRNEELLAANSSATVNAARTRDALQQREFGAQAETTFARARETRGEATTARQQADMSADSASRLGQLGVGGRMKAKAFYNMLKANPELADYSPAIVQGAMQYDPREVQAIIERRGTLSPEFQAGIKGGAASFPGDPEALRQRAIDLENRATGEEFNGEQTLAKEGAATGEKMASIVRAAIRAEFDAFQQKMENDFNIGRNR
jgi:hypothetical protein